MIVEHAIVGITTHMLTVTTMKKMYKMLYISRDLHGYTKCRGPVGVLFFHDGLFHLTLCSSTLSQYPSLSVIPSPLHHSFSIIPLRPSFSIILRPSFLSLCLLLIPLLLLFHPST
jgi:hypothetical protein